MVAELAVRHLIDLRSLRAEITRPFHHHGPRREGREAVFWLKFALPSGGALPRDFAFGLAVAFVTGDREVGTSGERCRLLGKFKDRKAIQLIRSRVEIYILINIAVVCGHP